MRKRIFIAVTVSKIMQDEISRWEEKWRRLPVRWLSGKNLHITLIPPWYDDDIEWATRSLGAICKKSVPFEIFFEKVSFGPDPRFPRLIWAVGKAPMEMIDLKKELSAALEQNLDKRNVALHLTLARFRPENIAKFPITKLDELVGWKNKIESFVLMESYLYSAGVEYEILQEFKMANPLRQISSRGL